eukprot:GEMP01067342.1.p1 GENE.GEMP01067342.1~~GEMP01067342.1.p1  ORF type:complete len:329 (+),score=65.18 GEMP01067342.1:92-1078(+)
MVGIVARNNMDETQDGEEPAIGENWPVLERVNEVQPEKMDNDANGTPENSTTANERDSTTSSSMNVYVPSGKLFVGGLPQSCKTEDLKWYFRKFGRVVDGIVMTQQRGNLSRGFGFVTFSNLSGKTSALKAYNRHHIHGKWIEVRDCVSQHDMEYQKTTYLDNNIPIDHNMNNGDINQENQGPQDRNFSNESAESPKSKDESECTPDDSGKRVSHQRMEMMQENIDKAFHRTSLEEYHSTADIIGRILGLKATYQKLMVKVQLVNDKMAHRQRKQQRRNDMINRQRMLQLCSVPLAPVFPRCTVEDWAMINMWGANPFGDSVCGTPMR